MRKDQLPRGMKVSKHGAERPQKPKDLSGTGRRGRWYGGWGGGGGGDYIPIAIDCHHQNDSYSEMG